MGVSITAYSHLRLTDPHEFDADACYDAGHTRAYALLGFEQSLRGVADHDKRPSADAPIIGGRCYEETSATAELRIFDSAYSAYGRWREALCHAIHGVQPRTVWGDLDTYRHAPFFELIHFADNEGCIGPDAAADLLTDFTDHAGALAGLAHVDDWLEGLRLAADDGLIEYR